MNPDTNRFEHLAIPDELESLNDGAIARAKDALLPGQLVRPNGEPVPDHWSIFTVGEEIPIKGHVFKVAYIGETSILFEPVGSFKELQRIRKERAKAEKQR